MFLILFLHSSVLDLKIVIALSSRGGLAPPALPGLGRGTAILAPPLYTPLYNAVLYLYIPEYPSSQFLKINYITAVE